MCVGVLLYFVEEEIFPLLREYPLLPQRTENEHQRLESLFKTASFHSSS